MTAEIRGLRADELDEALRLSQFAFQYELTPEEIEQRKQMLKPAWMWAWFENGQMAAKASFLQLRMFIGGEAVPMGGVGGVATWPEHRRSGKVAALLGQGLQLMRERGEAVSLLAPFAFPFYAKYGWTLLTERRHYTFAAGQIAQLHAFSLPAGGQIRRVDPKPEWELLNGVYRQYALRYNGMLDRDLEWWQNFVLSGKRGQAAVFSGPDGAARGYLLYRVADSELKVQEAVWLDPGARAALLKFLANHDSMAKTITLTLPLSDRLPYLLSDPEVKQEVKPYFMARLVDAAAFVAGFAFAPAAGELSLVLTDAHAPWNEGAFVWRLGPDGRATLIRRQVSDADEPVRCDIGAFTAMMLGSQRPAFLREAGALSGSDTALSRWEAALPPRDTYLMDFF